MGQIATSYDLMPSGTEVDLDAVIAQLPKIVPEGVEVIETKIAPVAFGLMKVVAGFIVDDADDSIGGKLESVLRGIDGIENIECVTSTVL